nr:MAG TPA: hypothetical protein [Caudoviricetes sp.]
MRCTRYARTSLNSLRSASLHSFVIQEHKDDKLICVSFIQFAHSSIWFTLAGNGSLRSPLLVCKIFACANHYYEIKLAVSLRVPTPHFHSGRGHPGIISLI